MAGEKRRGLTADELEALAVGEVVMGPSLDAWQKQPLSDGRWGAHETALFTSEELAAEYSPLRRMVFAESTQRPERRLSPGQEAAYDRAVEIAAPGGYSGPADIVKETSWAEPRREG